MTSALATCIHCGGTGRHPKHGWRCLGCVGLGMVRGHRDDRPPGPTRPSMRATLAERLAARKP